MNISYNPTTHLFDNIDPDWIRRCREAYPHVKLEQAMKQAALWLDADWPKRRKKQWERFLLNWFGKAERDALLKDQRTKSHPELAKPTKRPPIEELVPQSEIRALINKLGEMKMMPGRKGG